MIRVFITDGGPDAEDYDSNYFTYDESNTETTDKINHILNNCDTQDPEIRAILTSICIESLYNKPPSLPLQRHFPKSSYALNILRKWYHR